MSTAALLLRTVTQPTVTLLAALSSVSDPLAGLIVERYALALTSGMTEGELLGLKWEDMNLAAGTLSVTKNGLVFEAPKNGKGRRVKLTARATETLRAHLECQLE
jgi:integrase